MLSISSISSNIFPGLCHQKDGRDPTEEIFILSEKKCPEPVLVSWMEPAPGPEEGHPHPSSGSLSRSIGVWLRSGAVPRRQSALFIAINSYQELCPDLPSVTRLNMSWEGWAVRAVWSDHHLDPRTRTIHQKLVRKPSRDRKHLSEMHNPCIMCVCLRCNISSK